jgi:anaerobic magnesium-protoporphyrin IX monomethyl ester cyclase
MGEVEHLYKTYGFTNFAFYDDELNVNPELNEFLDRFIDLKMKVGVDFKFRAFLKYNVVKRDQMKKLYDSGMTVAVIGGESGSERMLKNMAKKSTVEQNTRFVELAKEFGVHPKCIMSLGHPGESPETLEETWNWLEKVQLSDVNFTIISCLPSAFYYDSALRREDGIWVYTAPETKDRLYSIDVDFHAKPNILNGSLDYGYESTVFTDYLKQEDLVEWHRRFEERFRPSYNAKTS